MKIFATTFRTLFCTAALCAVAVSAQTPSTSDLPDAPSTTAHDAPPAVPTGPTVLFDTSMGRLTCVLFDKEAPLTVANFIGLATGTKTWTDPVTEKKITGQPFYDGTTFHRVIPSFMIQGGDRRGTGEGDAGYYFEDEIVPSPSTSRAASPWPTPAPAPTAPSSSSPKSPYPSSTASTPYSASATPTPSSSLAP